MRDLLLPWAVRTAPNMADAAVARLAQGTKVYAEGGHDRVFYQTFGAMPGEQLRKAYACYLSTSSGPIIGTLYLSTARLAFCSDSPVCYQGQGQGPAGQPLECMYYKASASLAFARVQLLLCIHLSSVLDHLKKERGRPKWVNFCFLCVKLTCRWCFP